MQIFKIPRAVFSLVSINMAMIFSLFMSSYISQFLIQDLKISKQTFAYYIAIWATAYTVSSLLVGPLSKLMSSTTISFISYLLIAIGCFLFGPSELMDFESYEKDLSECVGTDVWCRSAVKGA